LALAILYLLAADDELLPSDEELPPDEEPLLPLLPPELAAQANPAGIASASPIATTDAIKTR